jgi:hypothetical protein
MPVDRMIGSRKRARCNSSGALVDRPINLQRRDADSTD